MAAGLDLPEQFRKTKMQTDTDQKSNSVIQKQDPIPTELQIDGNKVINGPVSYTHLDVYKRQGLYCRPACRSVREIVWH